MKKINTYSLLSMVMAGIILSSNACNQKSPSKNKANWADSTFVHDTTQGNKVDKQEELCFAQLKNAQSKDSSFINLSILGDKVTGKYSWIPFEKDSRTGSINGTKRGDTIDVVWSFMQEGMQDTLRTVFLLQPNTLKQKPYTINQKTGREVTNNQSDFSISYQKINCE